MDQRLQDQPTVGPGAFVAPGVVCGREVQIGARTIVREGAILYDHVVVGNDCVIGPHVILGEPEQAYYRNPAYTNGPCRIGNHCIIRAGTVIYATATLGHDSETGSYVSIRERAKIGHHCRLGTFADIQADSTIGNYVSLHSNVTVGALSVIEDYAWLMPFALLINDWYPPTCLKSAGPVIGKYAVVGARATIYPGVQIGTCAVIGANSIVKTHVSPYMLVTGDPAKIGGDARKLITLIDGKPIAPYPWMKHRVTGYPWEHTGFVESP